MRGTIVLGATALGATVAAANAADAIEWLTHPDEFGAGGLPGPAWDGDGSQTWARAMADGDYVQAAALEEVVDSTPEARVLALLHGPTLREIDKALDVTFTELRQEYDLPRNVRWYALSDPETGEQTELQLVKAQRRTRATEPLADVFEASAGWIINDMPWLQIGVWTMRYLDVLNPGEIERAAWAFNRRVREVHRHRGIPSRMQMTLLTEAGRNYLAIRNPRGPVAAPR